LKRVELSHSNPGCEGLRVEKPNEMAFNLNPSQPLETVFERGEITAGKSCTETTDRTRGGGFASRFLHSAAPTLGGSPPLMSSRFWHALQLAMQLAAEIVNQDCVFSYSLAKLYRFIGPVIGRIRGGRPPVMSRTIPEVCR
jgi:hypothetical protein